MNNLTNETQTKSEPKIRPKRPRGTGSIYQQKGSSNWWIQYYQNGKSYRESTGTDNRRRAEKILQSTLGEISRASSSHPISGGFSSVSWWMICSCGIAR